MSHEDVEILGPAIQSRSEAQPLIRSAISHFKTAKRATIQTMADLRRLQDGQVHTLYGYKNFAKWAEDTFEGLSVGNVRQLCRAGAVVLELEKRGLVNTEKPEGIGTTGLRELSVVASTYGQDKMVEVFATAKDMAGDREVSGTNVEAALRLLMPPAADDIPVEQPVHEDDDEEDDEPQTEYSAKCQELIDRVRDLAYDLPNQGAIGEMDQALKQLAKEISAADVSEDQTWIDGAR